VEQQHLREYIIMPSAVETFSKWQRTLQPSATVEVRIPHARHGNAGKPCHAAKLTILEHFLQFVDCNTQPKINGRAADSTYFIRLNSVTEKVVAKVRSHCFGGRFENAPIHVLRGREVEETAIPDKDNENYVALCHYFT